MSSSDHVKLANEESCYAWQVCAHWPPAAPPRLQAAGCTQVTPEVGSLNIRAGAAAGAEAGGIGEGGGGGKVISTMVVKVVFIGRMEEEQGQYRWRSNRG